MLLKELAYLYHKIPDYKITNHLSIKHPTYKEIVEYGEEKYITLLYNFCLTPHDFKSELADMEIDWDKVNDLEWFAHRFTNDANIIFTEDIHSYNLYIDKHTGELIIYNSYLDDYLKSNHIKLIRERINFMIGNLYKEHEEFPSNEITRKLLIEEDRIEKNRRKSENNHPSIKDVICNVLINRYFTDNEEDIKNKMNYDFEYKDLCLASEFGFKSGVIDVILQLANDIYVDLQEHYK